MQTYLIDLLQCPKCQGPLEWKITQQTALQIETGQALCTQCQAIYPVREGIGNFLTPDLPREDLWEQADSQISQFLQEHPEIERQLMGVQFRQLGPADQMYRAMVLEERNQIAEARQVLAAAEASLYTPEYLICKESQQHFVLDHLAAGQGPIVDLASGRGELVELMVRRFDRPVVATDFSLRVLRRDRRWLEFYHLYEKVSLLAFDARRTPFKDRVVQTLTTNFGLANIRASGDLLRELRRITSGEFLAVTYFFPEADQANRAMIRELDLEETLYLERARAQFAQAGWKMQPVNGCSGKAAPTPTGRVLQGAGIDTLPVAETVLEWCTLLAS